MQLFELNGSKLGNLTISKGLRTSFISDVYISEHRRHINGNKIAGSLLNINLLENPDETPLLDDLKNNLLGVHYRHMLSWNMSPVNTGSGTRKITQRI